MKLDRCEDADCTVCTDGYDYAVCLDCHKINCPRDLGLDVPCNATATQVRQAERAKGRAYAIALAEARIEQQIQQKAERLKLKRERIPDTARVDQGYTYPRAPGVSDEAHAFNVSVRQGSSALALHLRQKDRAKERERRMRQQ